MRPLSRRPGSCTSWGDRRGRPPLSGTSSASTCRDVQTSERQSPPSPDHQPGSHLAPVLPLDGGEQVDEHQGRHGHRDQELAAKHSAENKLKINENVRGMEMSNEDIKIKIRKEAEKPENSTNVTCGSSSSSFDVREENEENSRRRKKVELKEAEAIKIEIRKEAEKLQNHTCVSSLS